MYLKIIFGKICNARLGKKETRKEEAASQTRRNDLGYLFKALNPGTSRTPWVALSLERSTACGKTSVAVVSCDLKAEVTMISPNSPLHSNHPFPLIQHHSFLITHA